MGHSVGSLGSSVCPVLEYLPEGAVSGVMAGHGGALLRLREPARTIVNADLAVRSEHMGIPDLEVRALSCPLLHVTVEVTSDPNPEARAGVGACG